MKRAIRRLFKILLILASIWWIYSNHYKGQQQVIETISQEQIEKNLIQEQIEKNLIQEQIEKNLIQEKIIEIILQNQVLEMESANAEKSDIHPLFMAKMLESTLKQEEKELDVDQKCLKELKEMLKGHGSSGDIEFENDFLKAYLITNNYEIDKATFKIQNFLKLRENHPYFFKNLNFDISQNPAYRFATLLPREREDGSATMLFQLGKWNPDDVPFEHLKQVLFMMILQELRNPVTQAGGFNAIYDFENAGFQYFRYGSLQNLKLLNHVTEEVLPVKHTGIHLINVNIIGRMLITLIMPFLNKSTLNVYHVHSSVEKLLDFFPRSMLPVQYGGTLTDYYSGDWIQKANEQHDDYPAGGQKNKILINNLDSPEEKHFAPHTKLQRSDF